MWRLYLARPELRLHEIRAMSLDDVDLQLLLLDRVDAARAEAAAREHDERELQEGL